MTRIAGFDGIRGLAVLTVVLTHLHVFVGMDKLGLLPSGVHPMVNGNTGVQMFFVLSGFLITHLLIKEFDQNKRISIRQFYIRRALRILPVYFLCMAFLLIVSAFWETGIGNTSFLMALTYTYNFIPRSEYSTLLGHTWSLAVEEHFYLVWPLIFATLFHTSARRLTCLLVGGVALTHVARIVLVAQPDLSGAYFIPHWTVVAGGDIGTGCLAALLLGRGRPYWRDLLGHRGALCLGVLLYSSSLIPELPHAQLRPLGIGLLVAWIYLNRSSALTRALEFRPLAYLGTISYGVYMYQGILLATGPHRNPGSDWPPDPLVGLILLCIIAPLSFHYLERPLLRIKARFSAAETPLRPAAGEALAGQPTHGELNRVY
jgi:peptidoglycan/LPS O-acetylase OafA/YrhL